VERHATLGDAKQEQGILEKAFQAVKQHVANTPADDHAQHAVKQDVAYRLRRPAPPTAMSGQPVAAGPEKKERQQVHDPVPVDIERAQ